ncbi:MAG: phenylalanyl-tRNA synthetase beta chain [Actinomycetota bacterium]|nr:phenylalanyl-tRNA synthetase beta chain [Actinomycetota bacterium]
MRIVWSWLQEFCPTEATATELAERLTLQGVKVENVIRPWEGLSDVVVARVVSVEDHPDSDKLCVATVDDGTEKLVVCAGVRNFAAGDLVPWAKPGSRVPTLPEPLAPRKLRGVLSNGMLCSPQELNIADVHAGILILNDEGFPVGSDLKTVMGLDDEVLDIEVEPNRPDFLSVLGVAREVSVLTGIPLRAVETGVSEGDDAAADAVSITIDAGDGCPRYVARLVQGVDTSRATPLKVQARLTASGMRPVSNVVDATNYTMIELGQPLHGFDLDRLAGPAIVVRRAAAAERLTTLDAVERELAAEDLLICDADKPIAIAGVMGGATSEVSSSTRDVLLESASFTREGILRTARRLGLHSEASHRFERGVDREGLERAASRCAGLITEWAGGVVARGTAEAGTVVPRAWVSVRPPRASMLLADAVSPKDAREVFDRLDMTHRGSDDEIEVEVPGYRVDIEREVDLIEEIARIRGYDRIGSRIPSAGQIGGAPPAYAFRIRAREALVRAGLREVSLLSFASKADLALVEDTDAIPVANPLQADEGFLRTRLAPGLLHAAARNRARGADAVAIFEVGTVFRSGDPVQEHSHLAFVLNGRAAGGWAEPERPFDVLDAKGIVEFLMGELAVVEWSLSDTAGTLFHPARSAHLEVGGEQAGVMGELHPAHARTLELGGRVAVVELDLGALMNASRPEFVYADVPRFPPIHRDLAFIVPEATPAGAVVERIKEAGGDLLGQAVLFDVFRGPALPPGSKSLAFSVDFQGDRTLEGEEADAAVAAIVAALGQAFGAELRAG